MKRKLATSGRDTFQVDFLRMSLNGNDWYVQNTAPFLVRGKWYYQPEIRGNGWDEPNEPEWYEWITLYVYETVVLQGPSGLTMTITPACDLTLLLGSQQLDEFFECLREQAKQEV